MTSRSHIITRRNVLSGAGAAGLFVLLPACASAQGLGSLGAGKLGLSSILGKATDSALDKLAQPGTYYGDEDIRIGLPFLGDLGGSSSSQGGLLGKALGAAQSLGVIPGFDELIRGINDAAGVAAGEAKPIFRSAIDDLSFDDAPGIIREDDGGTQYLRSSSNDALHEKLQPLIDSALESAGIHSKIESLAKGNSVLSEAGLNRSNVNQTVTDQGLDGIFKYVGNEEREFRKNPVGNVGNVLGDILGN